MERESRRPVAGATVQLEGRAPYLTDAQGRYRFERVAPGRYGLTVAIIGFAPDERTLVVREDTTVVIELERAPVRLDSLVVEGRTITVRGRVTDAALGTGLIDVDIQATPGRHTTTDPLGRFKLNRLAALAPIRVTALEFGYLPASVTISADRDTTLHIGLEVDAVAAAMIAEQKQRIAARARDYRYPFDSVIDRPELLRNLNGSPWDLILRILGARARKVRCVVIDERPVPGGGPAFRSAGMAVAGGATARSSPAGQLAYMLPDRLEYIDVLKFGSQKDSLMIRAYTREFVQRMTGGGEELVPLERIIEGAHVGACR